MEEKKEEKTLSSKLLIYNSDGYLVNFIIENILNKEKKDELNAIILDNSMVNYDKYNKCPNLVLPICKEQNKFLTVISWLYQEMKNREEEFNKNKVNNLSEYNERTQKKLPRILLFINDIITFTRSIARYGEFSEFEFPMSELCPYNERYGIEIILATKYNFQYTNLKSLDGFFVKIDESDFKEKVLYT